MKYQKTIKHFKNLIKEKREWIIEEQEEILKLQEIIDELERDETKIWGTKPKDCHQKLMEVVNKRMEEYE